VSDSQHNKKAGQDRSSAPAVQIKMAADKMKTLMTISPALSNHFQQQPSAG